RTTVAERIPLCFGREIWLPGPIWADGEIVQLHDRAYHVPPPASQKQLLRQDTHDQRWVRVRRPTVVVGGELTMDNLEIRHNPHSKVSEAPLQMKSNGGCPVIAHLGRDALKPT